MKIKLKGQLRLLCVLLQLVLAMHASAQNAQQEAGSQRPTLTAEQWREDLRFLAEELPKRHKNLFHKMTRAEFDRALKELDAQLPALTNAQAALGLARIVAMVGDGHTSLRVPFAPEMKFRALPARFYIYREGMYVQEAAPEYADLAGAKVISIGIVDIETAIAKVGDYIPHDNKYGIKDAAPAYLTCPEVLQALGLISNADEVDLTVEKNGKRSTVKVRPVGTPRSLGDASSRKGWIDARDGAKLQTPLWLKDQANPFWFEYVPKENILYIKFGEVLNKADETVEAFFAKVSEAIRVNDPEKLVLDIRTNDGGNNGLVPIIIRSIVKADKLDRKGKFFVIIGRQTFSAAQNLTNELEKYTNAIFVGEPTASHVNMFGDAKPIFLPNSKLRVNISSLLWQNMSELDRRQWTAPDVAADLTFADYSNNIDTAMQAVINYKPQKSLREIAMELFQANDLKSFRSRAIEYKNNPSNIYKSIEAEINSFGYRLVSLKRMDEAIDMFKLNTELYPESANAYDSLGEAYATLGRRDEALRAYEKALQIAPDYPSAREALRKLKEK